MPLWIPQKCLRGLKDCYSLAQIESDCGKSFVCVGHNDGSNRKIKKDRFTLCWKNEEIDEIGHWDKRDLIDTASVICQALSADANMKASKIKRPNKPINQKNVKIIENDRIPLDGNWMEN